MMVCRGMLLAALLAAVVLAAALSPAAAFAPVSPVAGGRNGVASTADKSPSAMFMGTTKEPPAMPPIKDISYGEESRRYRRTVYTHDDWRKHRSPDRFIYYIRSLFSSGVYKNLGREVTATTAVATFVCLYNCLAGGYTDFEGVKHAAFFVTKDGFSLPMIGLPLAAFTLTSPSLGLLLVFRTNTGYQRWDEARKNWGMNINHTR